METGKLLTFDITNPLNRQPTKEGHLRRRLIHSDILKKDNGLLTQDRFTFPKELQETATSRACFIHHTPVIHNFVFSFYSVQ